MKNLEVRGQRYEDQERSENLTIRLNLFQHLDDPKNPSTLMKTALLVNGLPSPPRVPVLRSVAARPGCSFLVKNSVMTENEVRS